MRLFFGEFPLLWRITSFSCISAKWLSKKKQKTFASSNKNRTFASRLLSHKDKQLIHSKLIFLCPGGLTRGEENI
ncbi:hypothetical protein Bache_0148 [Bacteroides helcogenes P 36-108]|uniref:Uncharacterized protein n=2 Tax=Bacteroides helcogenes TaxID=290053 RepID=E6SSK6_BACT6|nr:hypothetical protein Bache_0148 [Bacteroides helcogenes P 36-108]